MEPGFLLLLLLLAAPPGPLRPAAGTLLPGKLGERPAASSVLLEPCGSFCVSDGNCPGSERCLSTGCGQECRLPAGAKMGFCPRLDAGRATICLVECGSDSDCPGREKCCSLGCHVRCVPPVPARPGVCPKRRVLQTFAPCNSSCTDDSDCPLPEKCCFTGCALGCLRPDRGHPRGPMFSDSPVASGDICHLPPVPGPCLGRIRRYHYSPAAGGCLPFTYSGCGGNPNNFRALEECQWVCRQPGRAPE